MMIKAVKRMKIYFDNEKERDGLLHAYSGLENIKILISGHTSNDWWFEFEELVYDHERDFRPHWKEKSCEI